MARRPSQTASNTSSTNWSGTTGIATAFSAPSLTERVTRSSARLAESSSPLPNLGGTQNHSRKSTGSKKRKAPRPRGSSTSDEDLTGPHSPHVPHHLAKRQKLSEATTNPGARITASTRSKRKVGSTTESAMSSNGAPPKGNEDTGKSSKSVSQRSSSRSTKRSGKSHSEAGVPAEQLDSAEVSPSPASTSRRQRKRGLKRESEAPLNEQDHTTPNASTAEHLDHPPAPPDDDEDPDQQSQDSHEPNDDDSFAAALFGRGAPAGLSTTLRALSGMMSGISSRLRDILNNLRQVDNPTLQLIALEELSNLLLVSNEDNLSGQFSPDPYIKELVALMQPNPITGEENPEIMLLACRCIANLMEALRGSVANVVYGGAVPVLCQKLLDIQYIDVAEQALSTLSKVSIDFPASIVREGGLTACLQFLDFFATGTQRTAVTTAANCCRNIPHDSFPVIRDVMPILQSVLVSHDQKVVEQGCLCVTRIVDSFKRNPEKLEELVDPPLLRAILGLLLPGITNLIGPSIHTEFLRVLAIVARASPCLATELLKMNVVDTLYQALTGVSPPAETADVASKIDSVVVMQALIHRPREQIYETLDVICELMPRAKSTNEIDTKSVVDLDSIPDGKEPNIPPKSRIEHRVELLKDCKPQTRRFAMILLPTLTDAYSSTVNLSVRQKVLTAQLRILSNLEVEVIEEALRPVPYASFLASILSQEDHPTLTTFALQAAELLFERLEDIYQYQFYREGVIGEIQKLAARTPEGNSTTRNREKHTQDVDMHDTSLSSGVSAGPSAVGSLQRQTDHDGSDEDDAINDDHDDNNNNNNGDDEDDDDDEDDEDEDDEDDQEVDDDEIVVRDEGDMDSESSESSDEEHLTLPTVTSGVQDLVILRAKQFLDTFDTEKSRRMKQSAVHIRQELQTLAAAIADHYSGNSNDKNGTDLFSQLAQHFDGDALESITSSELLDSGIIHILGKVLAQKSQQFGSPRDDFLAAFMGNSSSARTRTTNAIAPLTCFSVLIQKLQDLLSRTEHFEVLTVNSGSAENSRSSSTSMLLRQIRLKLSADADSEIPATFRDMIVSIHAIATFKALDDYLRPRISLSERPLMGHRRREMLQQLANARMAQLQGAADSGMFSLLGTDLGSAPPFPSEPGSTGATSRVSGAADSTQQDQPKVPVGGNEMNIEPKRRRSSRRGVASLADPSKPEQTHISGTDAPADKLECADERAIDDASASLDAEQSALDAIVGEIEGNASDDEAEPAAVNMELGSSGKVTARQEDGTRVFTPQQSSTPVHGVSRPSSSRSASVAAQKGRDHSEQPRPSTYAAALSAAPQEWHIEFSIDQKVIPQSTTIYRAVHHNRTGPVDVAGRGVWSDIHSIKFRRVKGPPSGSSSLFDFISEDKKSDNGLPASLNVHPITSSILSLLGILHGLNAGPGNSEYVSRQANVHLQSEPLASFINTKLTAKMNRQLEEPLIVASDCLPNWSEALARTFPFLFPFETRHLFLQSTSFGYSRSITRWQSLQEQNDDRRDRRRDDRPLMGRPQRQKVRISRSRILESAMKVMEMYGASPSVLEVEYFEEVGTGLGPTLEFYSTVSKEFSKKKLKMWRENESQEKSPYAFGKCGLFPAPMKTQDIATDAGKKLLHFFRMLGKFVARSMLDSRIIDVNFNSTFFKIIIDRAATIPSIALLRTVDVDLASSLLELRRFVDMKINIESDETRSADEKAAAISALIIRGAHVEDLTLDFTLPGYPDIELTKNGADTPVTIYNVDAYINSVLEMSLGSGVYNQIAAFEDGFSQVFSCSSLKAFTPAELVMLFGRIEEDWSIETLMDSIKADHGFNMDSKSVKNLLQVMSEFTMPQRRDFLQFVTGSPKLPIGGFKSLTPMFTVVCKASEPPYMSDDYLPSVMTCVNYLKLPDYTTQEVMKQKLQVAIREGQGAFHLS